MKRAWIGSLAVMAGIVAMWRGAEAAPLESRIPEDAIVYVEWAGTDALAAPYAQSNLKGVVDNTRIGEYVRENWAGWMEKAGEADADRAKDLEEALGQLRKIWQHPVALYVGPVGMADPTAPTFKVALVCDAGADAPALADAYKKMMAKNPPPPEARAAMAVDGTVVIMTLGDIKPEAFMPAPGKGPGLAGAAGYVAAMKHVQGAGAARGVTMYVDAGKAFALIKDAVAKSPDAPAEAKKNVPTVIDALGLSGLTQFAYAAGFDQKEWSEQAFVGTQGARAGLLGLFDAGAVSDAALAMVPKDAVSLKIGRVDLKALVALARDVVRKVDPEAQAQGEAALVQAGKQFDLDIEKNVIDALGDEWVSYRGPVSDSGTHPFVFMQKLRDGPALGKALDVLEQQVNALAGGRVKIEKIDAGSFEVTGIRLPQITVAWTIRDGYLYVSNLDGITGAVEQVEKKGESITLNADYQAVRKALPAVKAQEITYSEPAKLYPEIYRGLMALLPMARLAGVDLPADLLPMPKKIAPFLTPGGSVSWSDAEGFHFVSRSAMPGAEAMGGEGSPATVAGVSAVGVAIAIPSLARARGQAKTVRDASNMRQIGQLCAIWASEHDGAFPDHVAQLAQTMINATDSQEAQAANLQSFLRLLVSVKSGRKPLTMTPELRQTEANDPAAFAKEVDAHSDFVYLGKGLKITGRPDLVVMYEKVAPYTVDRINVLFLDCHVEVVRLDDLATTFKATNESLKQRDLPEVDVDAMVKGAAHGPSNAGADSLP